MLNARVSLSLAFLVSALAVASSACTATAVGPVVDDPYDSCDPSDACNGGLACVETTLPASTGFSGNLCTAACNSDGDCPQLVDNFDAVCVNGQCYLTCPSSDSCPYSQGCLTFSSNTGPISLCTP